MASQRLYTGMMETGDREAAKREVSRPVHYSALLRGRRGNWIPTHSMVLSSGRQKQSNRGPGGAWFGPIRPDEIRCAVDLSMNFIGGLVVNLLPQCAIVSLS